MSGPGGDPWGWARQARELAVQMLYQGAVGKLSIPEVAASFWQIGDLDAQAVPVRARQLAERLAGGTTTHRAAIDAMVEEASRNWRLERMPVMDLLILRLAVYELLHERETPAAVVIDEALELTRRFSTEEAVPFINGVLDAVKRRIERGEIPVPPAS